MKTGLLFVASSVLVLSSLAVADDHGPNDHPPFNPDRIHLIKNPREASTGLSFQEVTFADGNTYNSATGVCKALGFTSAIPGSDKYDASVKAPVLKMNDDGSIASEQTDFPLAEIICQDRVSDAIDHHAQLIQNPTYPGKNPVRFQEISFSDGRTYNSADGVCKALGFRHAVTGSDQFDSSNRTTVLKMNEDGTIASEQTDFPVSQIICEHPDQPVHEKIVRIDNPRYVPTGLPFQEVTYTDGNTYNSGDGICRVLGFERELPGSDQFDSSIKASVLKLNSDGSIASEQTDFPVSSITCFENR